MQRVGKRLNPCRSVLLNMKSIDDKIILLGLPGACFRAANVFSFEALFANNPFWCLNQKHVSNSRLGKLNQVMDLVTENATKFKMAENTSYCYNDFSY